MLSVFLVRHCFFSSLFFTTAPAGDLLLKYELEQVPLGIQDFNEYYNHLNSIADFLCFSFAQSAGAVEYTDCFSAEEWDIPKECPAYDTKQSDGEVPVMQELWRMRNTHSLQSLSGPLCSGVIAPDRVLSMGQTELNSILMLK